MEVMLNSVDVLQIAKALKSGWLDLSKIESLKSLVDGYNPPKRVTGNELEYYLNCLYKGWGYIPTDKDKIKKALLQGLDGKLLEKWQSYIEDESVYRQFVKSAFIGLLAIKGLGGCFEDVEPNFSFIEMKPPKFQFLYRDNNILTNMRAKDK